jgi:NitT/TauT family transport system substrate-binding protein
MMRRRLALLGALALAPLTLGLAAPAFADLTKVRVVHTSSSLVTPGLMALDKGFFAAHGLDVSFTLLTLNSTVPASLVSGSADIGFATTSTLVQANDGGIDLQAIAGTGTAYPGASNEAVVARIGSGITKPADYIGKRVAVPGIGVVMDIMFRNWLMASHVDPAKVNFVEVGNPQQVDALRSGTVDAVVANDPQLYRLVHSGVGVEAGKFMDALSGEMPIIVYAVTKDYAETHRDVIAAFQAAHKEGIAYVDAHPDEARALLAARLKLPPEVVKDMDFPRFRADVSADQIGIMVDMLKRQDQLQHPIDPAALVYK